MQRSKQLERIRNTHNWDVIIIGGGATGLGAGVDSASRGFDSLVLEGADFGQATSSRSTKLAHGGVRYLQQMNFSLVFEALHERGTMRRNAPHLVYDQRFIIPALRWLDIPYYGTGMMLYDLMSGPLSFGRSFPMGKTSVMRRIPGLNGNRVKGGVLYHDGQFDDARLTMTLAHTMHDLGGCPVNHIKVTGFLKENCRIVGVQAVDQLSGEEFTIRGRAVVNATGIFTDSLRQMDDPSALPILRPSQGIHLMLDKEFLPGDTGILIPKTEDGRVVFVLPWHDKVMVGTTDTPVDKPEMEPLATQEEIDYLLELSGRYLSRVPQRKDVRAVFNGIRPLVADDSAGSTSELSREHYLRVSPSGLVTIAGGKWTTYRRMAQDTIDSAIKTAGLVDTPSRTENLPLHGWMQDAEREDPLHVYGTDVEPLLALAEEDETLLDPIHERLPYLMAEVVWAVREEMAMNLYDVLALRTRSLLLDAEAAVEAAPIVALRMATELGEDERWVEEQLSSFLEVAKHYRMP